MVVVAACSSGATTSVQVTASRAYGRVTLTPEHPVSAAELVQAAGIITRRLILGVGGVRVTASGLGLSPGRKPVGPRQLKQAATVGGLTFRPVEFDGSGQEEIFAGAGPCPR